jgi:hypothetical protein
LIAAMPPTAAHKTGATNKIAGARSNPTNIAKVKITSGHGVTPKVGAAGKT